MTGAYLTSGIQTAKVVPLPSRELTSIFPPCCSTIQCAIDSPSPNPATARACAGFFGAVETLENIGQVFSRNAGTGIAHDQFCMCPLNGSG